jgi:hypothetical protein
MSPRSATPPAHVPVLTDVIDMPAAGIAPAQPVACKAAAASVLASAFDEARLVADVMTELQHRVDAMLEHRLREALAPLLTKVADDMVNAAKAELAGTLRDVLNRAVTQELARHRNRA